MYRDRERVGRKKERRRRKKKKESREKKKKKTQKSNPTEMYLPVETHRNSSKRPKHTEILPKVECGGCLVPVCIPVRDFPSIPTETERNIQLWDKPPSLSNSSPPQL